MATAQSETLQQPGQEGSRNPQHLSASDEDARNKRLEDKLEDRPEPFAVLTSQGYKPFFPPGPEPIQSDELPAADNPFNPKGQPSLSLPQQATPLTSQQGVLSIDDMADDNRTREIAATQDGLAPDEPRNPRGTPDYIVEEPSPQSNPDDSQHDGRLSHEAEPTVEPGQPHEHHV